MAYKLEITATSLFIRDRASASGNKVGSYSKGEIVNCDEKLMVGKDRWYSVSGSKNKFICGYKNGDGWYVKDYASKPSTPNPPKPDPKPDVTGQSSSSTGQGMDPAIMQKMLEQITNSKEKLGTLNMSTRLFGVPFQFTKETDFRHSDTVNMGRAYMQNIMIEAPVLYMIPGIPNYLPDVAGKQKESLTEFFTNQQYFREGGKSAIDDILKDKDARYYGFSPQYYQYIKYANLLCRTAAIYLGIEDLVPIGSDKPYRNYSWSLYKYRNDYKPSKEDADEQSGFFTSMKNAASNIVEEIFTPYNYVPFFIDASSGFSESASNSTRESQAKSTVEGTFGEMAKEFAFLEGSFNDGKVSSIGQQAINNLDEVANRSGIADPIKKLFSTSSQVLTGSNLAFPELWTDSDYSKSYSITMNLFSPYGDKESIYLNIIVPLMHILAFALPRQTSANSFTSPFLIRASYPGVFTCDLGMIESINIDKGEDWTVDGLASSMKVTITLKDLYSNLFISKTDTPAMFFHNSGLIDFIAVHCGVDIVKPQFELKLETMFTTLLNRMSDIPISTYDFVADKLKSVAFNIFTMGR